MRDEGLRSQFPGRRFSYEQDSHQADVLKTAIAWLRDVIETARRLGVAITRPDVLNLGNWRPAIWACCTRQEGGSECGLFTISTLAALANGVAPTTTAADIEDSSSSMRQRLYSYLLDNQRGSAVPDLDDGGAKDMIMGGKKQPAQPDTSGAA